MFATQDSTPWHRSTTVLIVASVLLPPLGLALLWLRRDAAPRARILGTLLIVVWGAGAFFMLRAWRTSSLNDAHYAALEQHRAQQEAATGQQAVAPTNPQNAPATVPATNGANPANPASAIAPGSPASEAAHAAKNYWTNFRGPNRDGRYDEMAVLTQWPAAGLTPIWKQPIGVGYASFVIADGRAHTIEQRRGQEVVTAYDLATGREVWKQGWNAVYSDSTGDGPRATPTWDDGRLYALGATGELRCLDGKSGAVLWGKNILSDNQASNLQWAQAASPLIVDDKVIVVPGGTSGKSVVAYNKMTGAPVWKSQNDTAAYVSPMLMTLAGRRQVVVISSTRVMGLAPADGALLWSQTWDTDMGINASQPIAVDQNHVFISAGYAKGAALVEVTASGASFSSRKVWENINMKNKFNSSVLHEGHIYGLDEGILTCLDVNTGVRKWKGGRYGFGQVILASGHLIVSSDKGELALVKATPQQYTEVSRFNAIEGQTWNYPAIAGGKLLIRNANEMAAYNIAAN